MEGAYWSRVLIRNTIEEAYWNRGAKKNMEGVYYKEYEESIFEQGSLLVLGRLGFSYWNMDDY